MTGGLWGQWLLTYIYAHIFLTAAISLFFCQNFVVTLKNIPKALIYIGISK
jgi:hypothetical protein